MEDIMNEPTFQALSNGTIELGIQPSRLEDSELEECFLNSITSGEWSATLLRKSQSMYVYNVSIGTIIFELYVYLFNVRSSSRGRAKEKRIQLNASTPEEGFKYFNGRTKKSIVLGVYRRDDNTIFCAWNSEKKNNNGKQKSCYINIEVIAEAMRDGFSKRRDNAGDVVCAFKSEFLHYYIMNLAELHD
jgi:hypothetical protein